MTTAEQYSGGYSPQIIDQFKQRTFAKQGAFLQSCLAAGLTVLDCGCGPGSMTLDIAEIVSPGGQVFGIDSSPIQIEQALLLQKERAIAQCQLYYRLCLFIAVRRWTIRCGFCPCGFVSLTPT